MSEVDFASLPISKMRSTLKSLGLSGTGTKASLIERYKAYQNGEVVADQTEKEEEVGLADVNQGNNEIPPEGVDVNMESRNKLTRVIALDPNENIADEVVPDENKAEELPLNEEVPQEAAVTDFIPQENDIGQTAVVDEVLDPIPQATESGYDQAQLTENVETEDTFVVSAEGTEATATTEVAEQTEATEQAEQTEAAVQTKAIETVESFDIEAELDKREARSKKFGTAFDREACRQQLLRANFSSQTKPIAEEEKSLPTDRAKLLSERRAKFGIVETNQSLGQRRGRLMQESNSISEELRAERQKKFGIVENNQSLGQRQGRSGQGMNAAWQELRAERQKKFGTVEKQFSVRQRGEKRAQPLFQNRKNRRYL